MLEIVSLRRVLIYIYSFSATTFRMRRDAMLSTVCFSKFPTPNLRHSWVDTALVVLDLPNIA